MSIMTMKEGSNAAQLSRGASITKAAPGGYCQKSSFGSAPLGTMS